jgi:hypothetical protein
MKWQDAGAGLPVDVRYSVVGPLAGGPVSVELAGWLRRFVSAAPL